MAEMIQVQVPGGFRLERGVWYRVETAICEHDNGSREFHSTKVTSHGKKDGGREMTRADFRASSNLTLMIRISDTDNPHRYRERVVTSPDLWAAIHELLNVAGPDFAKELMSLSWSLLTPPTPGDPPDAAAPVA